MSYHFDDFLVNFLLDFRVEAKETDSCRECDCRCFYVEKGLKQLVQPDGIANIQTMASKHHCKDVPNLASESHAKL